MMISEAAAASAGAGHEIMEAAMSAVECLSAHKGRSLQLDHPGERTDAVRTVDLRFSDRTSTLPSRLDYANALAIKSEANDDLLITHVVLSTTGHGMTDPQVRSEAYSARVYLDAFGPCEVWCDGRQIVSPAFRAGTMLINDMRHEWRANPDSPFNVISFFIPQSALDQVADEQGGPDGAELRSLTGAGCEDGVFRDLAQYLLPAVEWPEKTSRLFADHLSRAVVAHLVSRYGSIHPPTKPSRGGLAPWQERSAKEMLMANLSGEIRLAELAKACRLSVSHFSQAFKQTVGCPPYRWLMKQRIEHARHLITSTCLPLCEIALSAGFADQSHFTRVFSQHMRSSPAAWRRAQAA